MRQWRTFARAVVAGGAVIGAAGCGSSPLDRGTTGAAMGAGAGLAGAALLDSSLLTGAAIGAVAGGAVGVLTTSDQLYLGEPVWDQID